MIEYVLGNQREVTLTAVDALFHKFMLACQGRSLSDDNNTLFTELKALFTARNKLAHDGIPPTAEAAIRHVHAAGAAFTWLDS